jgi:hypothetical protein
VGKFQKGQKVSGKKRDTPNRLTAVKGALASILARDAKDIELIDAVGTPEFDRLLKAQEQEPWPDEWVNQLDVSTGPSVLGGGSGDDPRGAGRTLQEAGRQGDVAGGHQEAGGRRKGRREVTARRDALGRQPKLDGALIDLVGEHLRAGLSIARTCMLLGVSKASYYSWVAKAHETTGRGIHGQFLAAVRRGLAEYEVRLLSAINEAAHGDPAHGIAGQWQAAAWTLERRFPHRYGTQADRLEGTDLLDGPAIESSDGMTTGQSP